MKAFLLKYYRPFLKTVAFVLIFVLLFSYVQDIFGLKGSGYGKYTYYNRETENTVDVIYFGNSRCNRAFDPLVVDDIAGTYSYNLGIQGLRAKHVYIRMQDAFKTQTPGLVIIETGIFTSGASATLEEQYNHRTLVSLPTSVFKLKAAVELAETKEKAVELFLPLLRFHSRYKEIGSVDFIYNRSINDEYDYENRSSEEVMQTHRGYTSYPTNKKLKDSYHSVFTKDYSTITELAELDEETVEYLDRMVELCRSIDAQILFVSVPAVAKSAGATLTVPISNYLADRYAADEDIAVLDMYLNYAEIGLDYMYFQNTSHLNVSGAQLVSTYMGEYIAEHYGSD